MARPWGKPGSRRWPITGPSASGPRPAISSSPCPNEAPARSPRTSRVHGPAQTPTHLTTRKEQAFVTRVSWKGKGKTLKQVTENIREGVVATVIGRKLDQGVLVQLVIDDTDIRSVHTISVPGPKQVYNFPSPLSGTSVAVSSSMETECCSETTAQVDDQKSNCAGECPFATAVAERDNDSETSLSGWLPSKGKTKSDAHAARVGYTDSTTGAQIQLPEIGRASAAGEWLIPEDGVLVIGFGPHTVADADGKAVVREHLAVITAEAEGGEAFDAGTIVPPPPVAMPAEPAHATTPASDPDPAPRTAAAIPSLPSRSLPQGVHADGTPSVLPPLPEEEQDADPVDDSKSDEPLPSPQRKRGSRPAAEKTPSTLPLPLPRLPIPGTGSKTTTKKVDHKAAKAMFSFPQLSQFKSTSLLPFPMPGRSSCCRSRRSGSNCRSIRSSNSSFWGGSSPTSKPPPRNRSSPSATEPPHRCPCKLEPPASESLRRPIGDSRAGASSFSFRNPLALPVLISLDWRLVQSISNGTDGYSHQKHLARGLDDYGGVLLRDDGGDGPCGERPMRLASGRFPPDRLHVRLLGVPGPCRGRPTGRLEAPSALDAEHRGDDQPGLHVLRPDASADRRRPDAHEHLPALDRFGLGPTRERRAGDGRFRVRRLRRSRSRPDPGALSVRDRRRNGGVRRAAGVVCDGRGDDRPAPAPRGRRPRGGRPLLRPGESRSGGLAHPASAGRP